MASSSKSLITFSSVVLGMSFTVLPSSFPHSIWCESLSSPCPLRLQKTFLRLLFSVPSRFLQLLMFLELWPSLSGFHSECLPGPLSPPSHCFPLCMYQISLCPSFIKMHVITFRFYPNNPGRSPLRDLSRNHISKYPLSCPQSGSILGGQLFLNLQCHYLDLISEPLFSLYILSY